VRAGELLKMGFDFVIAGADTQQLRAGAASAIAAARKAHSD
jgi:4-hydroxy-2-oxoheptanedioate aldolase